MLFTKPASSVAPKCRDLGSVWQWGGPNLANGLAFLEKDKCYLTPEVKATILSYGAFEQGDPTINAHGRHVVES